MKHLEDGIVQLKIEIADLERRLAKVEKATSLFVVEPKVPDGWCQICGMEKAACIHAG